MRLLLLALLAACTSEPESRPYPVQVAEPISLKLLSTRVVEADVWFGLDSSGAYTTDRRYARTDSLDYDGRYWMPTGEYVPGERGLIQLWRSDSVDIAINGFVTARGNRVLASHASPTGGVTVYLLEMVR